MPSSSGAVLRASPRPCGSLGAGGAAGAFAGQLLTWAAAVTLVPLSDESPTDDVPPGVEIVEARAVEVVGTDEILEAGLQCAQALATAGAR